jgi:hypothetical protein
VLIDQPEAFPLARRQQFDRIVGDRRSGRHSRKLTGEG